MTRNVRIAFSVSDAPPARFAVSRLGEVPAVGRGFRNAGPRPVLHRRRPGVFVLPARRAAAASLLAGRA